MKVIVIGGVAAGMSAAAKIKRVAKDAQVTVYERGNFLSYGACGLAYYVGGFYDDHTDMIVRTRAEFERQGIRTFLRHEITNVDTQYKTVTVKNLETGETFADPYDKLMIATGADVIRPDIPGMDKKGIFTMKTMEDGLALRETVQGYGVSHAVVIGGGYLGVEAAEALARQGKKTVLLEMGEQILSSFCPEIAEFAVQELRKNGVEVRTGATAAAFEGGEAVKEVRTDKGSYLADVVVLATGIRPNTGFLKSTGINLAKNGALFIDRQMRTSLPDIYAAGDCATVYSCVKKENIYMPLGTTANKCGRIAGTNICGQAQVFEGTVGSAALKVFDLELGRTGLTQSEAEAMGFVVGSVVVESINHPSYYPGMAPITIKLIYEKQTMRILGAQIAGGEGAALRTDLFAVAVQNEMTTKELGMADLIYSPPFANVWDAVQIAANAAK